MSKNYAGEKTQNSKEVRSEAKRQRIIDAAIGVFAQKGFQDADVQAIAEACSVGKGTIYLYFKGKEDLFWETGASIGEQVCDILDKTVKLKKTPLDKLTSFFADTAKLFENHPDYISIITQIRSASKDHPSERVEKIKKLCLDDFLCGLFQEAITLGLIPDDIPRNYTISLVNSIWGIMTYYYQEDDVMTLTERTVYTVHLFLNGIKIPNKIKDSELNRKQGNYKNY